MTILEIASLIRDHLIRFEADPEINIVDPKHKTARFYGANAFKAGTRMGIKYISYQNTTTMSKADAALYLAWLDAGNVGKHYAWQQTKRNKEKSK